MPAQAGLLQQQNRSTGTQIGLSEPLAALTGWQGHPFFHGVLLDRQVLLQNLEHGLIAVTVGIEPVAQTQCFSGVVQHTGIGQPSAFEDFKQAVGQNAVQADELGIVRTGAQQLEVFNGAVVREEVVIAVVAPVHLGSVLNQPFDFRARQLDWQGGQAAQFGLGVFIDDLRQRQDEQP